MLTGLRALLQLASARPIGAHNRLIVLDECHQLSKSAWNLLLKPLEDGSEHTRWILCTSEPKGVIKAAASRCVHFGFEKATMRQLEQLLGDVARAEAISLTQDSLEEIASAAGGSYREALVLLDKVRDIVDDDLRVHELIREVSNEDPQVIDFCRELMQGNSFPYLAKSATMLGAKGPESVRRVVCAYFAKVATGNQWERSIPILRAFGTPYGNESGAAPLIISLAQLFDD